MHSTEIAKLLSQHEREFDALILTLEVVEKSLLEKERILNDHIEKYKEKSNYLNIEEKRLELLNDELGRKSESIKSTTSSLEKEKRDFDIESKNLNESIRNFREREENLNTRIAELDKDVKRFQMEERRLKLLDQKLKAILEDKEVRKRLKEIE